MVAVINLNFTILYSYQFSHCDGSVLPLVLNVCVCFCVCRNDRGAHNIVFVI